ncbi:1,4-dihydroxy-2-naphthoate octaprenyltransferase [Paenibacillus shirakamiensis]|uniref:1,4-dihydroxy-2-naphthoate octaprenyltransferase n=1 Tax=Paenibacillus shirakamiensis TaxID=1265935 RepID=A0ABS4JJN7_9BACL|nr:prenyltransferase [Paenibacillus shirakamiensis]MBP2001923.1 1,4-dihydroxy-2-naphthoate octaprenyltransferase [Paenibacillus shirakamiensis]
MNKWTLFKKASRFQVIPVMLVPVILGALGAYVWKGVFHPVLFILTLVGAGAAHLFSNMVNDLWDYRSGADTAARDTPDVVSTNSGFLANGTMSERTFAMMTWSLFGIAALCGITLAWFAGWPVLVFSGLGGLIAYFYVAPPLQFGYRGKGLSEIAILLSFGVLPIMGTYYVQTQELSALSIMLSLPVGLLTTLVLFNHHFLHWQADRQAGKNTLVVVWGEERALRFSKMLLWLSYISVVVCVLIGALPVYGLLSLLTIFPLYKVYTGLSQHNPSKAYLPLMGASVQASTRCGLIMSAALLIQGLIAQ